MGDINSEARWIESKSNKHSDKTKQSNVENKFLVAATSAKP